MCDRCQDEADRLQGVRCTRCNGEGYQEWEEDGRLVRDACYHCGNSGWIDEETALHDEIGSVAESIAAHSVDEYRKASNDDPHFDGWDLVAAEHGMRTYDYFKVMAWEKTTEIQAELIKLDVSTQRRLIAWHNYLVESLRAEGMQLRKEMEVLKPSPVVSGDNIVNGDNIPF